MSGMRVPNFDTFQIPFGQLDTERFKPQGGWKPDMVYPEDDYEESRDHYVDVHHLIEVCELPSWFPRNAYAVNALGWMVSRKGPVEDGESTCRRLGGTWSPNNPLHYGDGMSYDQERTSRQSPFNYTSIGTQTCFGGIWRL